jgi:hypothetical protein
MRNVGSRSIVLAALVVATPAAAQPVTQPKACQVSIVRAPDEVRSVIEAWVSSEPQCSVALEVRIVPTEGGLYLLAQDEQGRVRERIVPDAQTAGVLVASWIADDNAPPPPMQPPPPAIESPAPVLAGESLTPPGLAPISVTATAPPPLRRTSKWLTVGGLMPFSESSGAGLRIEADILRKGKWMFGAALSGANGEGPLRSSSGYGNISTEDYKFIAYVARPSQYGKWQLRPAVGLGMIYTTGLAYDGSSMFYPLEGTFATAEASFMVSRELGTRWAAYTGPLATVISQRFESYSNEAPYSMSISRGSVDLAMFAGVRRRL